VTVLIESIVISPISDVRQQDGGGRRRDLLFPMKTPLAFSYFMIARMAVSGC